MTSRIPPSRRDPEYAPQRAAKVVQSQTPGAGRVAQAAPVLSGEVAALLRGKASVAPGGVDSAHAGAGLRSTQVGDQADADYIDSTAVGYLALATADDATAVGSEARAFYEASSAFGSDALATAVDTVAVGTASTASAARAIAIGSGATSSVADQAVIATNELELTRSSSGTGTSIILADTVTGTRYRLSVASGALVIAPA